MNNIVEELFTAFISSVVDPDPIHFRPENEKGVLPVRRILSNGETEVQTLPRSIPRNSFLCGCLDFTENAPVEHLIIGYGTKKGLGTEVKAISHCIGSTNQVSIPPNMIHDMQEMSRRIARAELLIFHNHPRNWINSIFDNIPLPSNTDRITMVRSKYLQPINLVKSILGTGGVRFYLGENGFVREFKTPAIMDAIGLLQKFSGQ
ncbi:MAG: hypothetical protein JNM27_11355 [Leptospirales bacterium]|nr:hypothetical protein [Leptospirales bacterium]